MGASAVIAAALQPACSASSPSFLIPKSSIAASFSRLWWIFFALGAVIFLAVLVILIAGALRRAGDAERAERHPTGTPLIWVGGIAIPLLVLGTVFALSIANMVTYGAQPASDLTIEVIGHQWWWEVRYPREKVITANEIHVPVGQSARVVVTSVDVMHALWIPQLQGKIDAIPGHTNTITLQPSTTGTFRGQCLVYCGVQHANMNLQAVAEQPADFARWVSEQSSAPAQPTSADLLRGQQVFFESACVYCHTVAGTRAQGTIGPDLTHLGSRQQIAAGTLPNDPATLSAWIVNPQAAKPGNLMPPESFSGPDLQSLVAYLESLK